MRLRVETPVDEVTSDAWKKFLKIKGSSPYSVDLCFKEKEFTPCELTSCITKAVKAPRKAWVKFAEEYRKKKCDISSIENDFLSQLESVKACLRSADCVDR